MHELTTDLHILPDWPMSFLYAKLKFRPARGKQACQSWSEKFFFSCRDVQVAEQ